ncbi:MaoC/PaaZ C-terminal domain-containing protein [Anianabacter salinae]|uniref:MaoC/PaaZ C-terminal domain-containing protein n=1 Tax=Anianabacter salinae TaxID=2851023 RepID=UPI00225E5F70|nr:MaoC/PaaZ C-terminal domain-containing protein [Anianabacter salinae]MBV0911843.1 MaoC family dehydratase N-terminal domain-containing protein [Anianabacter salinae]
MPLDPDYLMALDRPEIVQEWTWKDAAIYALGLGYGDDPLDKGQLRFLDRAQDMQAMPAMVNVLGYDGAWLRDERTGIDYLQVVHGEHAMQMHGPLPVEGRFRARTNIVDLVDKGPGKGAIVVTRREITDDATGDRIATVNHNIFCRGAGGFGGASVQAESAPAPVLSGAPDGTVRIETPPQLALIYRLSGDLNPLHADPDVARRAGFERPILHGLSTFGIACRGLMAALCGNDAGRVLAQSGRFSAPVYPGETLTLAWWTDAPGRVGFEVRAADRDAAVLKNGRFDFKTEAAGQ